MVGHDREKTEAKGSDVDALMKSASKHWVRRNVWLPVARDRFTRLMRPIRYFTLTTPDMLDILLFEKERLIERTTRGYPGIGFCEWMEIRFSQIIRKLEWCPWRYHGKFEDMVLEYDIFEQHFDFDVVNADFTGVPFPAEAPYERTFEAIERLLQVQAQHGRSFDFFLTFRCKREEMNSKALDQLGQLLKSNLRVGRGSQEFIQRVSHSDPIRLLNEQLWEFLCLGVSKLFIGIAIKHGYSLSRYDAYVYHRVGGQGPYEIIKFIFSLEASKNQQISLINTPVLVHNYDEGVLLAFQHQPKDVDQELKTVTGLVRELQKDVEELIRQSETSRR